MFTIILKTRLLGFFPESVSRFVLSNMELHQVVKIMSISTIMFGKPDFKIQPLNWQAIYPVSKAILPLCWKIVVQYLKTVK